MTTTLTNGRPPAPGHASGARSGLYDHVRCAVCGEPLRDDDTGTPVHPTVLYCYRHFPLSGGAHDHA